MNYLKNRKILQQQLELLSQEIPKAYSEDKPSICNSVTNTYRTLILGDYLVFMGIMGAVFYCFVNFHILIKKLFGSTY